MIIIFAPEELKHRINTQVAIKLDGYVLKMFNVGWTGIFASGVKLNLKIEASKHVSMNGRNVTMNAWPTVMRMVAVMDS